MFPGGSTQGFAPVVPRTIELGNSARKRHESEILWEACCALGALWVVLNPGHWRELADPLREMALQDLGGEAFDQVRDRRIAVLRQLGCDDDGYAPNRFVDLDPTDPAGLPEAVEFVDVVGGQLVGDGGEDLVLFHAWAAFPRAAGWVLPKA